MKGLKAILLLGGVGKRFKSSLPKQFHRLAGKKVYLHTLEQFIRSGLFEEIILVCPQQWLNEIKNDIQDYSSTPIQITPGGKTRQQSSYLGLLACGDHTQYVVIHDGVRPLIDGRIIRESVERVQECGAVDTCIPSTDTLVHTKEGRTIASIPERAQYWRGQTPQSFSYLLILQAHARALDEGITNASDDCSLVLTFGKEVSIVHGEERNIKITSELDLFLAEQLLRVAPVVIPESTDLTYSLRGKIYAITGGTGGIGQALTRLLKEEGAIVIQLSLSAATYPVDLTQNVQVNQVFENLHEKYGALDGLINSAGLLQLKNFNDLSDDEIERQLTVNLKALLLSCRRARIKENGHIVNIASSSYSRGRAGYAIYSAAKAATVNFTQALAEELPHLYINVLVPERTDTKMRQNCFPNESPSARLSPDQVASSIVTLLKQRGITGSIIPVRKENRPRVQ